MINVQLYPKLQKRYYRIPRSCLISKNHCLVAASYNSILLSYILLYKKLRKRDRIKVLMDRLILHYLRCLASIYICTPTHHILSLSLSLSTRKQKLHITIQYIFPNLQISENVSYAINWSSFLFIRKCFEIYLMKIVVLLLTN